MSQVNIRNFSIIAHIDHGKSTLADRLLELTGTLEKRRMQEQVLDSNPIERERGITIKLAPVRMQYKEYVLNLIDTPGHVDFSYEVSRSLAACEGAILVVDATQGIQAQTLAHLKQARGHHLTIIPVVNKIDLPNARIKQTGQELSVLGLVNPILISAKTGQGVEQILEAIVERIPSPQGEPDKPLRALVFSSQYDPHKGVIVFIRLVDGTLYTRDQPLQGVHLLASGVEIQPLEIGYFQPARTPQNTLFTGEVGYIATGLKDAHLAKIGDTIVTNIKSKPLLGYREPKPMVFLGLFPVSTEDFPASREAMERLHLSDSAFTFRPISSLALGNGYHCGFLGLLHAEVVQERILREFGLTMIATVPSVEYHVDSKVIQSPAEFPDHPAEIREPVMEVKIFTPKKYLGAIMQLAQEKRGKFIDLSYQGSQAYLTYYLPLSEMIIDFFDRLKSVSEGYASLDYEFFDYQSVQLVKIDILLNHEQVDAFAFLTVVDQAQRRAREIVEKLATAIPRAQFSIPVQGVIGSQVIARADVKPFRKDVTKKLYGGDRTRKDKLLDKQKRGKAKMKMIGKVEIPQSAFFAVLKK